MQMCAHSGQRLRGMAYSTPCLLERNVPVASRVRQRQPYLLRRQTLQAEVLRSAAGAPGVPEPRLRLLAEQFRACGSLNAPVQDWQHSHRQSTTIILLRLVTSAELAVHLQ